MDIFSYEIARRIGDQNVLHKVNALMDWYAISVLLKNGLKRSGLGPQGYKRITLFKCLLIGQWHNLSDPNLEQSLRVRVDFILFSGIYLHGSVPDETTYCRFCNALVKTGTYDALLSEVCRQKKIMD
jgi:transposase, IS5 family